MIISKKQKKPFNILPFLIGVIAVMMLFLVGVWI